MGRMMKYLNVEQLSELAPVFKKDPPDESWTNVYREMSEWAVLFELARESYFGTDTVIVCDGFLRSKMFSKNLFGTYRRGLEEGIRRQFEKNRRRIYICGIAERSAVLQTYRVAMALENIMRNTHPCYVEVPLYMEERAFEWDEWAKRSDKFVAGKMFLVKFGTGVHDPIWPIDVLLSQKREAQTIFGYLLEDAKSGFPRPLYPQCIQRARENATLLDFDRDFLQDQMCEALREGLGDKKWVIDELVLQGSDPASDSKA
jgi:hypothetical protein